MHAAFAAAVLAAGLATSPVHSMTVEDLDGARQRATERAWSGFIDSKRRRFEHWAAVPRDRAGWLAGLGWQYVDAASGRALAWTPDTPEPAAAPADVHAAWVRHVRSFNIHITHEAAHLCRVADVAAACTWALAQLDFYAAHYAAWPLQNRGGFSRLMGQALEESTMLVQLLDSARLLEALATDAQRRQWRERLFVPATRTIAMYDFGAMNIGIWNAVATSIAGLHLGDEGLLARGLTGPRGLRVLLARGINADGLWTEGSFGYANYVIAAVGKLLTAADVRGQSARVEPEREVLRRLVQSHQRLALDDGTLPAFGDVVGRPQALDAAVAMELFRSLPLPALRAAIGRRLAWETMLEPAPAAGAARAPAGATGPPGPAAAAEHWPASRLAVFRAGPWHAVMRYGTLPLPKFQAEALHFDLRHRGTAVTTDLGSVEWGLPLHLGYFRLAPAHNVVLIDGEGPPENAPGVVERFDADAGRIEVLHADYRGGVQVRRSLQLDATGLGVDTQLRAPNDRPRRLGVVLHLDCDAGIEPQAVLGAGTETTLAPLAALPAQAPAGTALSHWSEVQHIGAGSAWVADLRCGGLPMRLSVRASLPHGIYRALGPTPQPGLARPLMYLEARAAAVDFSLRLERRD